MESNSINLEGGDDAPEDAMAAMGQNIQIDKDGSSSMSSNIYKTTNDKDEKESAHFMTVFGLSCVLATALGAVDVRGNPQQ